MNGDSGNGRVHFMNNKEIAIKDRRHMYKHIRYTNTYFHLNIIVYIQTHLYVYYIHLYTINVNI